MAKRLALVWVFFVAAGLQAQQKSLMVEHGTYTIHSLLHAIGKEEYRVIRQPDGQLEMQTTSELSDRGSKRASTMTFDWGPRFEPLKLVQDTIPAAVDGTSTAEITAAQATIREAAVGRTLRKPPVAFVGFASMPASLQMVMMRYWHAHGDPSHLTILRASPLASAA